MKQEERFPNLYKDILEQKGARHGGNYCWEQRMQERFFDKYFQGKGIDIGGGSWPITKIDCKNYDKGFSKDWDAIHMKPEINESYDWVYSSHCLEHLNDPITALKNWWRILKPGGYLIITVPDICLFEKMKWPKEVTDHKYAFSLGNYSAENHIGLVDQLERLPNAQIRYCLTSDGDFNYDTGSGIPELEIVTKKLLKKYSRWTKY